MRVQASIAFSIFVQFQTSSVNQCSTQVLGGLIAGMETIYVNAINSFISVYGIIDKQQIMLCLIMLVCQLLTHTQSHRMNAVYFNLQSALECSNFSSIWMLCSFRWFRWNELIRLNLPMLMWLMKRRICAWRCQHDNSFGTWNVQYCWCHMGKLRQQTHGDKQFKLHECAHQIPWIYRISSTNRQSTWKPCKCIGPSHEHVALWHFEFDIGWLYPCQPFRNRNM